MQHHQVQVPTIKGWYGSFLLGLSPSDIQSLQLWFKSVDKDNSGSIDANELSTLCIDGVSPIGFPLAAKLVKVCDKDRNGSIDFWEYCALHKLLLAARNAFLHADRDRSGTLQGQEIHTALVACGFTYLKYNTVCELLKSYDPHKVGLNIGTFTHLVAHVSHIRSVFEWYDVQNKGTVNFNVDQFSQSVTYLA